MLAWCKYRHRKEEIKHQNTDAVRIGKKKRILKMLGKTNVGGDVGVKREEMKRNAIRKYKFLLGNIYKISAWLTLSKSVVV